MTVSELAAPPGSPHPPRACTCNQAGRLLVLGLLTAHGQDRSVRLLTQRREADLDAPVALPAGLSLPAERLGATGLLVVPGALSCRADVQGTRGR